MITKIADTALYEKYESEDNVITIDKFIGNITITSKRFLYPEIQYHKGEIWMKYDTKFPEDKKAKFHEYYIKAWDFIEQELKPFIEQKYQENYLPKKSE